MYIGPGLRGKTIEIDSKVFRGGTQWSQKIDYANKNDAPKSKRGAEEYMSSKGVFRLKQFLSLPNDWKIFLSTLCFSAHEFVPEAKQLCRSGKAYEWVPRE